MLSFTQRDNEMLTLVKYLLDARRFDIRVSKPRDDGVVHVSVRGGTREVLRFLGSVRPRRLLDGMEPINTQMRGRPIELLRREPLGERTVVGLQTSSRTLMAEGFATHNSSVDHGGYSGGRDRERIDMFLCPNAT